MQQELKIVRPEEVQERVPLEQSLPHWVGPPADVRPVSEALGTQDVRLFFERGVRSRPHLHSHIHVTGTGVVAIDGGGDQLVQRGEFVFLPPNVAHMHGASDDGPASHISITTDVDNDWDCPIPARWERSRQ